MTEQKDKITKLNVMYYGHDEEKQQYVVEATYISNTKKAIIIHHDIEKIKAHVRIIQAAFPQVLVVTFVNDYFK